MYARPIYERNFADEFLRAFALKLHGIKVVYAEAILLVVGANKFAAVRFYFGFYG